MTAGNDGASTPEDDDPFGYLYADGQASGATPPSGGGGYGYPGPRSYNQVRTVGERTYGGQQQGGYGYPPQQGYGQQPTAAFGQVPDQQGVHQPNAHYQAPETFPGGPQGGAPGGTPHHMDGGRGRGPNTRGLLIGAIAVVAAVVIGIGVAMLSSGDDDDGPTAGGDPTATDQKQPSDKPSKQGADPAAELPKADAKALKLDGGAVTASDIDGAKADGGVYVGGLNATGASATWTANGIAKSGKYTLNIGYGVPGTDAEMTLTVNGKPQDRPVNMANFAKAEQGAWDKGWTNTWVNVVLNKGTNELKISCEDGDKCDANLDQVWLVKGWKQG